MVDYYALISPTIEPLADASPDERKVVYERLVLMLDQQLRAAEPPRSDKDILKERINLEAAIRRVERGILNNRKKNAPVEAKVAPPPQPPVEPRIEPIYIPVYEPDPEPVPIAPVAAEPLTRPVELPAPAETDEIDIPRANEEPVPTPMLAAEAEEPLLATPETLAPDDVLPVDAETPVRPFYPVPPNDASPVHEPDVTAMDDGRVDASVDLFPELNETIADKSADLRPGLPSIGSARPLSAGLTHQTKGLWLRIGILALVILALASAIGGIAEYLAQRSAERAIIRGSTQTADVATTEEKISDRLPIAADETPKAGAPSPGAKTASGSIQAVDSGDPDILIQRAILLEEPPGGLGDPKRTVGKVSWKLETLRSTLTNTSDIGARATIDLTEAGLTASFVFRRNRDQSSANTHLIEISMTPSPDNPNGKIRDINVPELRVDEKTRGTNLSGIAVPVADNVFLIGLSGLPADMQRNIELLRNRSWFLVQLRYSNGKRALLIFEKGKPGERVFEDAMQTWQ